MIDVIPALVNEADNHFMTAIPSLEELKETVFEMSGDSAPGLDGFSGSFYQAFWDIIKDDLLEATEHFKKRGYVPLASVNGTVQAIWNLSTVNSRNRSSFL